MSRTRFIMIGGFLGAGKTTVIARLAHHFIAKGLAVGLVTNDQANNLVDTQSLRSQGFHVGEVPGACFCCKFDDLVSTVSDLSADRSPNVIITEPVGSCTDLVATVIQPLENLHGNQYELAPYVVLCKPEHGKKILGDDEQVGFSPKAAYIFLKQLEEADIIVLNKIDTLSSSEQGDLVSRLESRFPDAAVLTASGKTGEGFDTLIEAVSTALFSGQRKPMEVDYDLYAEGEAELGWLNCGVSACSAGRLFSLDEVVLELAERIADGLSMVNFEPAHLKILGQTGQSTSIANQVSSDSPPELSLAAKVLTAKADLLVNARVAGVSAVLAKIVENAARQTMDDCQIVLEINSLQHFSPGRPKPTYRVTQDN